MWLCVVQTRGCAAFNAAVNHPHSFGGVKDDLSLIDQRNGLSVKTKVNEHGLGLCCHRQALRWRCSVLHRRRPRGEGASSCFVTLCRLTGLDTTRQFRTANGRHLQGRLEVRCHSHGGRQRLDSKVPGILHELCKTAKVISSLRNTVSTSKSWISNGSGMLTINGFRGRI